MWVDVVRSEHGQDSIISLVGNKIEKGDQRQVRLPVNIQLRKDLCMEKEIII